MLFDGIKLVEGSEVQNLVVDTGSSFPSSPNEGEMFYRNDGANEGLYVYNGSSWIKQLGAGDAIDTLLPDVGTPGTYNSVSVDAKGRVTAGTNPTTLSGYGITDAQPIDADLTAIAAISATSGLLKKTASNTWTLDTNAYITGNQTITVTGDVTGSGTTGLALALATTGVAAGSYGTASSVPTIAVDSKGRITTATNTSIAIDASAVTTGTLANARVAASNVTQHQAALTIAESQITDGALLARNAGNETITGSWTFNTAVVGQTPTLASHLTTKDYVDNIAAGVAPQKSVKAATTANITLSGTQSIDGASVTDGDRVLVKDQTTASQNGIYVVSSGSWTRANDFDGSPTNEVVTGSLIYVESGTANGNSSWILVTTGTISIGTTALSFSVFSRPGDFTAGNGLTKTGNNFNVGTASSSRIVVNVDDIDLATTGVAANTYASVTVDAYGRVTAGSTTQTWSSVSGTPTTLSGYGITDGQPLDSDLTAIAALTTTGLIIRTGTGSATTRSIGVTGTGISITNGDGVSGNPTITSNATSANTASTLVARDASGNFVAGTITAALSGNASTATALATGRTIAITGDATGTSAAFDGTANASISVSLANVGSAISNSLVKITTDAKGRVTGSTAVAQADITGLLGTGSITNTMLANAAVANLSGTNTGDQTITLTGEVTGSGTGSFATTVSNAAVIGKVLTGFVSGSGTVTATDSILTAIQKLSGNVAAATTGGTVTSVSGTGSVNGLTLTGTVTSSGNLTLGGTLANIANSALTNSSITLGSTNIALGATASTLAGLTSVTSTTFVGALTGNASTATTAGTVTTAAQPAITSVGTLTSLTVSGTITGTTTGNLPLAGGTMTGIINHGGFVASNAGAPVAGTDLTTKNYVDAAIAGLSWKNSVKAATTTNITLSGTQTVDGIALIAGDRVLVKNQTALSQNGVYVVAAGTWTRATDADSAAEIDGSAVYVQQGTTQADTGWTETATVSTLGSDSVVYAQFSGSGSYTAGTGLSLVGNTFNNTGVTSVALSLPSIFSVSGSPVTTTGTLSATLASQTANTIFAAPNGAAGAPTFRALVAADIPTLNQNTTGTASNVTGTVSIANGGTGATTAETAIDALGGAAINPATPKDGDIQISAGPTISIYASGAYRQIFPAVYS